MKTLIGLTGPSAFTQHCIDMIETFFDADFVLLYHNDEKNLKSWLERCDGFCLAGGADIHPSVYDNSIWSNQGFSKFDLKRDIRELQIIEYCNTVKKPYLGICRGHQLIGITLGFQLIPDLSGSDVCHQAQKQGISLDDYEPLHSVKLLNPQNFAEIFNYRESPEREKINKIMGLRSVENLYVNSFHHQGLAFFGTKKLPPEVKVYAIARADVSNIKEIIELMGFNNWVSCQWHPEFDYKVNTASKVVLEKFKTMLVK